jgi:hypothetical protein
MMFGSSLLPVVCRRAHVLFTLFVFSSGDAPPEEINSNESDRTGNNEEEVKI